MNIPDIFEVEGKKRRIKAYMEANGYEAVIIGRQENFAWFTGGGSNRLVLSSDSGFAILVITKNNIFVVSQVMDGFRIMEEELEGLGFEPVLLRWFDESREQKAAQLVKGMRTLSDIPVEGAECIPTEFYYKLHFPLTDTEIERSRWIAGRTDQITRRIADEIRPGMTEQEIEAMFLYEFAKDGMSLDILLIGSDERIRKFRHPYPSEKKVERLLLLHPAPRKWGLHAAISRMVYFGDKLPEETAEKFDAACKIQAAATSMCVPGERFNRILKVQEQMYEELGYKDEWGNHFHGGINGFLLNDALICNDPDARLTVNQAYNWYITITGVKSEEEVLSTDTGVEIASVTGVWPTKPYSYNDKEFMIPQILMK